MQHWVWSSCMEVLLPFRCGWSCSIFVFHLYSFLALLTAVCWEHLISLARKLSVEGQMGITCLDELAHCCFAIHCWVKILLVFCFLFQIKLGSFQSVQWGTDLGCFGKDSHEGVCKYYVPWEMHVYISLPKQHVLLVATLEVFRWSFFSVFFTLVLYALFDWFLNFFSVILSDWYFWFFENLPCSLCVFFSI